MAHLSPSVAATIRQFADHMDIEAFEATDGAYSFNFERSGRLSIVAAQDDAVVVSLTASVIIEDMIGYASHAARGGHLPERGMLLHTGINRAGQPVLAVRTTTRGFDMPFLQQSFEILSQRLNSN